MKLLPLLVFLTSCATIQSYYDVDENQNDPIYIKTVVALNPKAVQNICGAPSCIKRNIAMIIYEKGKKCLLGHEEKHARYGPKESTKIIWC